MAMLAILAACHGYFACGNKVLFCSVLTSIAVYTYINLIAHSLNLVAHSEWIKKLVHFYFYDIFGKKCKPILINLSLLRRKTAKLFFNSSILFLISLCMGVCMLYFF